jgi:Isochorismatase family
MLIIESEKPKPPCPAPLLDASSSMLSKELALLAIIDVQGKLVQAMHQADLLLRHLQIIIRGAQILQLPILWAEQNPAGLGPTVPEVSSLLAGQKPFAKTTFSACGNAAFLHALRSSRRQQVLLAGIEAHVCIYLTGAELLSLGYEVEVVADAVASRLPGNKEIGLAKLQTLGAGITSTETALFELLGCAEGASFKEILKLVK